MIICGIDLETTGLDFEADRITELAYVIKDTEYEKPIRVFSELLYDPSYPKLSPEITKLTGIPQSYLELYGIVPFKAFAKLERDLAGYNVDFMVAHNGVNFDRPFLLKKIEQEKSETMTFTKLNIIRWVDTQHDIEYPESMTSKRLTHLASEYGFLNPFPHSALFDVYTMLRILGNHDINTVMERSLVPWVVIQAHTSYEDRELAKKRRFRWESLGDKSYPKMWVKRVKSTDVEKERAGAPFQISILES